MVVSLLKGIRYNMEILDIYDEHGNLTGRTAERSTFLSKGEYFLCAHVILENQDGLFLVQKRSDTKATRPAQWMPGKRVWTVHCVRQRKKSV